MKLSKSKLALAKVINENGGWVDGSEICSYNKHIRQCVFYLNGFRAGGFDANPFHNWHQCVLSREEYYQAYPKADADGWIEWNGGECPVDNDSLVDVKFPDGSEYFNTDAYWDWSSESDTPISHYRQSKKVVKPEFCESVMRSIPEPESIDGLCAKVTEENKHQHVDAKPTIDKLAQDYRNKLDFAKRKQQESDDARVAADAALVELERAGEALGLLIGIAKPDREPELVITDWRDLQVNDVIFVGEHDGYESGEYVVVWLEDSDYDGDFAVIVVGIDGIERCMDTAMEWRFISRP